MRQTRVERGCKGGKHRREERGEREEYAADVSQG